MIVLTAHERDVMNHVLLLEEPEEWIARNIRNHGEPQTRVWLDAKVKRWEPIYLAAKESEGAGYRTAKQRHAADTAALQSSGAIRPARP